MNNKKSIKNQDSSEEGFFERAHEDNILTDALLSPISENDILNMIVTEQSFINEYVKKDFPTKKGRKVK